jgi:chromate transporter
LGFQRAGWVGLLVAGVSFALPSSVMVVILAWVYLNHGAVLISSGILDGMKPVVVAVIAVAIWKLGRTAVRSFFALALVSAVFALDLAGGHELLLLFGAGALAMFARAALRWRRSGTSSASLLAMPPVLLGQGAATGVGSTAAVGLGPLFLVFLKVGAVLFGGGYVLFAFLHADLVERRHWLTEQQLLDAIAVGQLTPGPVSTTATFIGYILRDGNQEPLGPVGALVATVAIFLPAFLLVALSGPVMPRLRRSKAAGDFLDGVNAAALALMAAVTWRLGASALVDVPQWQRLPFWLLALASVVLLVRFRVNSFALTLAGALCGWILVWIHGG